MTALLGSLIPVLYFVISVLTTRWYYFSQLEAAKEAHRRAWRTLSWEHYGRGEYVGKSVLIGAFWPVTVPFYLAFTIPPKSEREAKRLQEREVARRQELALRERGLEAAERAEKLRAAKLDNDLREVNQRLTEMGIDAGQHDE